MATTLSIILVLLKATCLLLIALCATLAMQRASARSRHVVWLVALGALLVLPALAAWGPLELRVLPVAETTCPGVVGSRQAAGSVSAAVAAPAERGTGRQDCRSVSRPTRRARCPSAGRCWRAARDLGHSSPSRCSHGWHGAPFRCAASCAAPTRSMTRRGRPRSTKLPTASASMPRRDSSAATT